MSVRVTRVPRNELSRINMVQLLQQTDNKNGYEKQVNNGFLTKIFHRKKFKVDYLQSNLEISFDRLSRNYLLIQIR
jgi:hypothetical protein